MSCPHGTTAWYPMPEPGWPEHGWIACDTWLDGARIFARIEPHGDATVPPMVMLHGLVVSGAYFRPVARYLDDRYRLYVPDLPGFGRSDADGIYDLVTLTHLLERWMAVHELSNAVVVANSLGCQVATLLAVRYPARVSRLVMVAPTMDPDVRGLPGIVLRGLVDIPRERQGLWRIWIPDFLASGPLRALLSLRDAFRDPQPQRLPRVWQPVLCVAGERDPICPPNWVRHYSTLMPDGQCVILPEAAHAMNYSAPRALARTVMRHVTGE